MPEIAWTTEIAGAVTRPRAEQTGLAPGTPVIVGTIDAAAEAISVGVLDPGEMMLMYGSTIFTIRVGPSASGIRGSGMRRGCSPANMPRWLALRPAGR